MSVLSLQNNNRFISVEGFADWFNVDIPMYYCEFEQQRYHDHLFDQMDIKYSDSLTNAVIKRRAEFLAGRYCAKHSLRVHGVYANNLKIGKHRNPLWPEGIIGSISHCGNLAVAMTDKCSNIYGLGIDIEAEVDAKTMEILSLQVLSDEERSLIYAEADKQLCLLFTLFFSIKESFFKAAYPLVEQYFDFDAVSVINIDWSLKTLRFRLNKNLHQCFEKGMIFSGAFTILPDNKVATLIVLPR